MKPKRTDDKYWTGTRNFNHIQYESDLEDYIIDLENEMKQLRLGDVVGQSKQLFCSCDNPNGFKEMEEGKAACSQCGKFY